jgi:hypothetical protein
VVAPFLCGYRALGNDYASMASVASSSSIHSTAWKVNSKKSGHLIGPNLFKSPDLYAPPQHVDPSTRRGGPQRPSSRLWEGVLCTILQVNFAEFYFYALG